MKLSEKQITDLRAIVYQYYEQNFRPMPWRSDTQPYYVLVSEYMLQQTQVVRVLEKFQPFIDAFPSFKALAAASQSEVLTLWSGLGYNRRALFLKRCAEAIVDEYNGVIPETIEQLCKLPGIGKATASAILVYSFNAPIAFLETNVKTVLIHHFFRDTFVVDDKDLDNLAKQLLDCNNARHWHWALMDYGTFLKKTEGNLTRRSKSYTKQSKFEGSRRQVRGRILKALVDKSRWTHEQLIQHLAEPSATYFSILKDLEQEGFVRLTSDEILMQ